MESMEVEVKAKDKYDLAVDHFLSIENDENFSGEVLQAWNNPNNHPHGCLFYYLSPTGNDEERTERCTTGCLTQVKNDQNWKDRMYNSRSVAWTEELTQKIYADDRIPSHPEHITRTNILVFPEYQRIADATFRQTEQAAQEGE